MIVNSEGNKMLQVPFKFCCETFVIIKFEIIKKRRNSKKKWLNHCGLWIVN